MPIWRAERLLLIPLLLGVPAWASPSSEPPRPLPSVPDTEIQGPAPTHGPFVRVPPGSMLTAEVRPSSDGGMDERTFRSDWSFHHALSFYDHEFQRQGVEVLSRRVHANGVTFEIRKADGRTATVIVQATKPTIIETRQWLPPSHRGAATSHTGYR